MRNDHMSLYETRTYSIYKYVSPLKLAAPSVMEGIISNLK